MKISAQKQYATLNEYLQAVMFGQLEAVQAAGLDKSYFSESEQQAAGQMTSAVIEADPLLEKLRQ